jgi:predicted MFS family arabinose efflux permease
MLMPFGSAYTVHNIGIPIENLPYMYLVTGVCTMASGLLAGKACDSLGYLKVFDAGTLLTIAMVITYTHLGPTPFPLVILVNVLLFAGISARMVSSQTLMAMVPSKENRGAFMSISSSVQQVAGGIAAVAAGMIVAKTADEKLLHFEVIGYAVAGASLVTMILNHAISRQLAATKTKLAEAS